MVDNKFLPILSQNLLEILEDDDYYDITIEVGKDPYIKIFRSHIIILYYRSPYLRRILSTSKRKYDGTLVHIKLPNILPEIFQILLRYIYGGKISLEEYDTLDIIKILKAANELSLQELITYLQDYLIENKADWMEQNFNLMNQTSFENDSFLSLQNFCTDLMSKEPNKIFKSLDFVSIPEKSLITLIQNDSLQMIEVQVWEHVLKWGLAQNPEISSDPSNYSKDDFNALKNTLQQCIPFIRFYNLTPDEFLEKVYPYKKVLPKELREDLIKCSISSKNKLSDKSRPRGVDKVIPVITSSEKNSINTINNERANVDSKIISGKHVELISSWIDKNKVNISEVSPTSYEFKLILRGSRDGFSFKKFHEICDNHSNTVSIIKVKDSDEILGGYNPIVWESRVRGNNDQFLFNIICDHLFYGDFDLYRDYNDKYQFGNTADSFIFSFKGKENIDNYILSRVSNGECAINNCYTFGPSFGKDDLFICNFSGHCVVSDYEKPIRETTYEFSVEEYEVFEIIQA